MSATITQHPSSISFAGNPVLLKAYSNLSEKTFLKVCAEVSYSVIPAPVSGATFSKTLSIPTSGNNEPVTFDLSDLLQSALSQLMVERNKVMSGGSASKTSGYVQYSVKVWDEYLDEYSEIVSTEDTSSSTSEKRIAILGAYTDMQRLTLSEDTASYLGTAHILTNKPDGEVVPIGGKVTVPIFSTAYKTADVYLDSSLVGSHTVYDYTPSWETFTLHAPGYHALTWSGLDVPPFFVHVVPEYPFARYFEFVNRLGAVESIYTFGRAQRKTSLTQERQVKRHNVSFRPSVRYVKRTLQEEQTLELSTGAISREWAKWFVEEFLVAESAWMYDSRADDMVPVIIEAEEAVSIYNESEAEVLDLPFKVTMCING